MIEPGFATMLCFVQTDAVARRPRRRRCARPSPASFERITVDGQMSTNDTVLLQATGASRTRRCPRACSTPSCCSSRSRSSPTARARRASPGSRSRAPRATEEAERVARAIANSPLVKTALYGRDPNWGRIAQAAGDGAGRRGARGAGPGRDRRRRARRRGRRGRDRGRASAAATPPPTSTSPTSATSTSGSTRSTRHDGRAEAQPGARRDAARGASVHPRVPRPHRGDQVRRGRDERAGAAERLRHRRGAAQVRPSPRRTAPREHRSRSSLRTWRGPAGRRRRRGCPAGPRSPGCWTAKSTGSPSTASSETALSMLAVSAEANTSAGAPCWICATRSEDPPKLKVTFTPSWDGLELLAQLGERLRQRRGGVDRERGLLRRGRGPAGGGRAVRGGGSTRGSCCEQQRCRRD